MLLFFNTMLHRQQRSGGPELFAQFGSRSTIIKSRHPHVGPPGIWAPMCREIASKYEKNCTGTAIPRIRRLKKKMSYLRCRYTANLTLMRFSLLSMISISVLQVVPIASPTSHTPTTSLHQTRTSPNPQPEYHGSRIPGVQEAHHPFRRFFFTWPSLLSRWNNADA